MADLPPCRLTRWEEVDRWSHLLGRKIRQSKFLPTAIVALTRGGWVAGRLIADQLGVKRLQAVRASHWGVTATPSGQAELTEGLNGPLAGETVLVVDDITDTGQSLELATRHVEEIGRPLKLASATFLHISHSNFVPTYYAEEIPRGQWVWVIFPWNYWEDLRTLANRALQESGSPAGVARLLRERCHLKLPLADVKVALADGRKGPGSARRAAAR